MHSELFAKLDHALVGLVFPPEFNVAAEACIRVCFISWVKENV